MFDFEESLLQLMIDGGHSKVGEKFGNTYYLVPPSERSFMLEALFLQAKEEGETKETCGMPTVRRNIMKLCAPDHAFSDSKKKENARNAVNTDITVALQKVWPKKMRSANKAPLLPPKPSHPDDDAVPDGPTEFKLVEKIGDVAEQYKSTTGVDLEASKLLGFDDE